MTEAQKAATPISDEFMQDWVMVKALKDLASTASLLPEANYLYRSGIAAVRDACNVLIGHENDLAQAAQEKQIADLKAKLKA